jgi:hypothetical protein
MPQNQLFEIPQQLRELAERNVEQARTAYGQLMDAMAQATGMWMSAGASDRRRVVAGGRERHRVACGLARRLRASSSPRKLRNRARW